MWRDTSARKGKNILTTPNEAETRDEKFTRIAQEIKTNKQWREMFAGSYDEELKALEMIAKQYGGESWNTGGGIIVAVIPLGPFDAMGVTGECIVHYHNSKATCMSDVFDEPENDTSVGAVSLLDDENGGRYGEDY